MATKSKPEVEYLTAPGMAALPFSEAVRVGEILYLSGQIGVDAAMQLVPGGIGAETRQALDNIKATLERHGSSLDRVVKVTLMLSDMSEWAAVNQIYLTYFLNHRPARSAIGANGLALGARIEIECVAVLS